MATTSKRTRPLHAAAPPHTPLAPLFHNPSCRRALLAGWLASGTALACIPINDLEGYRFHSPDAGSPDAPSEPPVEFPYTLQTRNSLATSTTNTPTPAVVEQAPGPQDTQPSSFDVFVQSSAPANGQTGVEEQAVIELQFNRAMDTASVEAAYRSDTLPADQVLFEWDDSNTIARIFPRTPLLYAEGSSAETPAQGYDIELATTAVSQEGLPLQPFSLRFTTLRRLSTIVFAEQDRNLTGNFRSDGIYGETACEREQTRVCIGESLSIEEFYRGFLTFDLEQASTPPIASLESALLHLEFVSILGAPAQQLGALIVEPLRFDFIDAEAFDAPFALPLQATTQQLTESGTTIDLLDALQGRVDVADQPQDEFSPPSNRLQYRLRFAADRTLNGQTDLVLSDWTTQQLQLTYLAP